MPGRLESEEKAMKRENKTEGSIGARARDKKPGAGRKQGTQLPVESAQH